MSLRYANRLTDEQLKEIYQSFLCEDDKIVLLDISRYDDEICLDGKIEIEEECLKVNPHATLVVDNDYVLSDYNVTVFFYNPNILNDCLYGRNVISKKEYLKENILILSEEEFMYYWKLFYEEYNWDLSTTQLKFENIFENQYYKKFLEVTNVMDDNYDLFEEFSSKEDHFSAIKDIAPEFTTIQMSYDVKDFCDNTNIYNYFSAKNPIDIAYVSARELLNNKKSFRLVRCGICNYYFIPKTSHTTLYCDEIYQDGKTCKEYAKLVSTTKTYESDTLCKKYRNRYKNLHKQASLSNNPKVSLLCEEYKLKGPKMLEKYQLGKITAEEFENWIDGMKIRK